MLIANDKAAHAADSPQGAANECGEAMMQAPPSQQRFCRLWQASIREANADFKAEMHLT